MLFFYIYSKLTDDDQSLIKTKFSQYYSDFITKIQLLKDIEDILLKYKDAIINKSYYDIFNDHSNKNIINFKQYVHIPYPFKPGQESFRPYYISKNEMDRYYLNNDYYEIPLFHHDRNFLREFKNNQINITEYINNLLSYYITKPDPIKNVSCIGCTGCYFYFEPRLNVYFKFKKSEVIFGKNKNEILNKLLSNENTSIMEKYLNEIFNNNKTININKKDYLSDDNLDIILNKSEIFGSDCLNILKNYLRLDVDNIVNRNNKPVISKFYWNIKNRDSYDVDIDERFLDIRINYLALIFGYKLIVLEYEPQMDNITKEKFKFGTEFIVPTLNYYNIFITLFNIYSYNVNQLNKRFPLLGSGERQNYKIAKASTYEDNIDYSDQKKELDKIKYYYHNSLYEKYKLIESSDDPNIMKWV